MVMFQTKLEEAICAEAILSGGASTASGIGINEFESRLAARPTIDPTGAAGVSVSTIALDKLPTGLAVVDNSIVGTATAGPTAYVGIYGGSTFTVGSVFGPVVNSTGPVVVGARATAKSFKCTYNGVRISHLDVKPSADAINLMLLSSSASNAAEGVRSSSLSILLAFLALRRPVLTKEQFDALARQLEALLGDEESIDRVVNAQTVASFRGLIRFLVAFKPTHPSLSINRQGLFVASWSPKKRAKLSLTFKDHQGGPWFAVSLDDDLSEDGEFTIENCTLLSAYASWLGL